MARPKMPKKIGRPKGQPNYQYVEIVVIPPACPRCKSTHLTILPGSAGQKREMVFSGKHEGKRYDLITWQNAKCQDCGQRVRLRKLAEKRLELTKPEGNANSSMLD